MAIGSNPACRHDPGEPPSVRCGGESDAAWTREEFEARLRERGRSYTSTTRST
jgi:hypothetical protein